MGTLHLHPRSTLEAGTISAYARDLDARRYVCPPSLEGPLSRLLARDGPLRVLTVTGPGGAGKSAALRESARRGVAAGYQVVVLDGREAGHPGSGGVLTRLDGLGQRCLLVVDEVDRLGAALPALGERLAELAVDCRVVVAARRLPTRWLPEQVAVLGERCRLAPLARRDAEAVLLGHGVADLAARDTILSWAGGLPLALVLGAGAWTSTEADHEVDRHAALAAELARGASDDLLARVAGAEYDDLDPELMGVAALAGSLDAQLLAAVLPGRPSAEDVARLRSCSFVDQVGGRLQLHPRVATVVMERLRDTDPVRAATTTLRIAAHEHDRALGGEPDALVRLAALVRDPVMRAGLRPTVGEAYFSDGLRPHDDAVVRAGLDRVRPGLWPLVAPWLASPATRVVRRADGSPVAVAAALPLAEAPVDAAMGRLTAPVVAYCRAQDLTDRAVVTPFQVTFDDVDEPEVGLIRNAAALLHCGVANPRIDVVNLVADVPAEREVLRAFGYVEAPGLRRTSCGIAVSTWSADVGAAGLAGLLYGVVAAEQGQPAAPACGAVLLAAVEAFHDDAALAALPTAPADLPPPAAAEHVRVWVRTTVTARLAGEPVLLDQVKRRYFDRGATHESVMRATFASRATYFRRLRRAREILGG